MNRICIICGNQLKSNRRSRCDSCTVKIRRYRIKLAAVEYKGGCCKRCGFSGSVAALDFHHVDNNKEFLISHPGNFSWEAIKVELDKCELLCKNCHATHHAVKPDIFYKEALTYFGKEFTLERFEHRKDGDIPITTSTKEYFCECGEKITYGAKRCRKCYRLTRRKVAELPSKEELEVLIDEHGYVGVGRIFGVSDNAVRKWQRKYNVR